MNVAVVGAAGSIGLKLVEALGGRDFRVGKLRLFDDRALGKVTHFRNAPIRYEALTDPAGIQLAFFFGEDATSDRWVPAFVSQGAVVIDHSAPSRRNPKIPLVVPQVNPSEIRRHRGVIATPNCATVPLVAALKPLHDAFTIRRVVATTLQAASGAGLAAAQEFEDEMRSLVFDDRVFRRESFPRQLSLNVIPKIGSFEPDGATVEERETAEEAGRILGGVKVSATCVRVPVKNAHGESVNIEFERPSSRAEAIDALRKAPGIVVAEKDDDFPTPAEVSGRGEVFVGRVRQDPTVASGLSLWVVADNLLRGTALNALDIAEVLVKQ